MRVVNDCTMPFKKARAKHSIHRPYFVFHELCVDVGYVLEKNFLLLKVEILNDKGKTRRLTINLSVCAAALGIIGILKDAHAKNKTGKDENGHLTGIFEKQNGNPNVLKMLIT